MSNLTPSPASISPSRRAWLRFKQHRLGFWSLILFSLLVLISLGAELVSNDKPLLARYEGHGGVHEASRRGLPISYSGRVREVCPGGRGELRGLIFSHFFSIIFCRALQKQQRVVPRE